MVSPGRPRRPERCSQGKAPEPAIKLGLEVLYTAAYDGHQPRPLVECVCPETCSSDIRVLMLNDALSQRGGCLWFRRPP